MRQIRAQLLQEVSEEQEVSLGLKPEIHEDPQRVIEPKDAFSLVANLRAIPQRNRTNVILLSIVGSLVVLFNMALGIHDQLSPTSRTYFYDHVDTDRDPIKIERYLDRLGVRYTDRAVTLFCRRYGANFTDCDIVLEWDGGRDFDRARSPASSAAARSSDVGALEGRPERFTRARLAGLRMTFRHPQPLLVTVGLPRMK